jgi:hypothetical protein
MTHWTRLHFWLLDTHSMTCVICQMESAYYPWFVLDHLVAARFNIWLWRGPRWAKRLLKVPFPPNAICDLSRDFHKGFIQLTAKPDYAQRLWKSGDKSRLVETGLKATVFTFIWKVQWWLPGGDGMYMYTVKIKNNRYLYVFLVQAVKLTVKN